MIKVTRRQHAAGVAWASLLVYTIGYLALFAAGSLPPLHVFFPVLSPFFSWALTVWIAFALLLAAFALWAWATSGQRWMREAAMLGPVSPGRIARRTGLRKTDWLCLGLAIVVAYVGRADFFWFPVAVPWIAVLAFLILAVPVEKWPVKHRERAIPVIPGHAPERDGDGIERSWQWKTLAKNEVARVTLWLRQKQFQAREAANPCHQGIPKSIESLVKGLVEAGSEDAEVIEAARQLLDHARTGRYNYFEEAQNTLQFVQGIPYKTDAESKNKEYFRFALETLYENVGDCDCKAILAATLFRLMGLRSVVLVSWAEEHAAVAVEGAPDFPGNSYFNWNGAKYYFCETTDSSFSFTVGEVPPTVDLTTYKNRVEVEPKLMGQAKA